MIKQDQDDHSTAPMAVVIVTYNSADVIEDCLDSLLASEGADLRVIVVDNKSPDNSIETILAWAGRHGLVIDDAECGSAKTPKGELPWLTLLRSSVNKGFAGGVNEGLRWALPHKEIDLFWILNPDCMVEPQTARAFVDCAARSGEFSLMGGRIVYTGTERRIHADGGRVSTSGFCESINRGLEEASSIFPDASKIDYIVGANMVASRRHIANAGLMIENYFLYYEEVDWSFRRRELPLLISRESVVLHHGGTSIGTGRPGQAPSPLSLYFNFRNRKRFVRNFVPMSLPLMYLWSLLKILQLLLKQEGGGAFAAILGLFELPPPRSVSSMFDPEVRQLAFGSTKSKDMFRLG